MLSLTASTPKLAVRRSARKAVDRTYAAKADGFVGA